MRRFSIQINDRQVEAEVEPRTNLADFLREQEQPLEKFCEGVAVVTQSDEPSSPCGACRQVLWEFCGDVPVYLANLNGEVNELQLATLFPYPFDLRPEES